MSHPEDPELGIDMDAHLDSGAELSLFNGDFLTALNITLINSKPKGYSPTVGPSVTGYMHNVRLTVPGVGNFDLEVGFSDVPIRRNLLGRDFFNLVQIGFREHQLQFFIDPTP